MSMLDFADYRNFPATEGPLHVVVTGGREYARDEFIFRVLDFFKPDRVCEGGARGADTAVKKWREKRGVNGHTYKADWGKYHRAAGPIRNGEMLLAEQPNLVLAFGGTYEKGGTTNCVKQAQNLGMHVIWFDRPQEPAGERP